MKRLFIILILLFSFSFAGASTIKAPNNLGLVGYWSMDEGSGTIAGDHSGNNNRGTLSGTTKPTWVSGKHEKALSFDGSTSYVDAGDISVNSDTFTVSAWIKQKVSTPNAVPVGKVSAGAAGWMFYQDSVSNGNLFFFVYNYADDAVSSSQKLPLNEWTHVVGVSDSTNTCIYINGVLNDCDVKGAGAYVESATSLRMGRYGNETQYFNGSLDDVRIYNRALSATEVYNLYKSGSQVVNKIEPVRLSKGLVGYWSFDGNTLYNNVADLSGNGNHGLLQPTTATSSMKTAGKIGQGLKFDGVNNYVNTGITSDTNFANKTFAVSTWFKSSSASQQILVSKGGNNNTPFGGWVVNISAAGNVQAFTKIFATNNNASVRTSSGTYNNNKWHLATVIFTTDTVTSGNNNITIYVDGQLDQGALTQGIYGTNTSDSVKVGERRDGSFMNGLIDDVRIYSRALNPSEIKALYNMGQATINKTPVNRLNQGLVGYWTFDGKDTATNIKDVSGNGNHGLLQPTNATSSMKVAGKIGQGLIFNERNANTNYVDIPNTASFDGLTTNMAVSLWVKPTQVVTNEQKLFISRVETTGKTGFYILKRAAGDGWSFSVANATDVGQVSALMPLTSRWYHIVMVYDGAFLRPYVDGAAKTPVSYSGGITYSAGRMLRIGGFSNYTLQRFPGLIDDVRIYSRALSAGEVKALYNATR